MRTDNQRIENNHSNIKLIYVIIATQWKNRIEALQIIESQ